LAVTISGGPAGAFAAADPPLAGGGVDSEQPAKNITATATALTEHRLTRVRIKSSCADKVIRLSAVRRCVLGHMPIEEKG
jgi:hypothetical protein